MKTKIWLCGVCLVAVAGVVRAEGGPGTCLAVADDLPMPALVMVLTTNGLQMNPWIVQPGGVPQMLVYDVAGELVGYVKSTSLTTWQNGGFRVATARILPPVATNEAMQITTYARLPGGRVRLSNKLSWTFHGEMTAGGQCNGTWVATIINNP